MTEIEDRWRELGEFIREQRRVGQLSLRKLSELSGISNPYLSQIERGLRKPSAEILRNIAGALSISAETLYVRAGILDERDGEHDLVRDIRRDPHIDEEQKKTLVHIYLSFRDAHGASAALVVAAGEDDDDDDHHDDRGLAPADRPEIAAGSLTPLDPLDPLDAIDPTGALRSIGPVGSDGDRGLAEVAKEPGHDHDLALGADDPATPNPRPLTSDP